MELLHFIIFYYYYPMLVILSIENNYDYQYFISFTTEQLILFISLLHIKLILGITFQQFNLFNF